MNMQKVQKGFTLIELMIVIAIVAILVALAVPAYQDYTIRAKVSECVNGAAPAKIAVSEYLQSEGGYPADADLFGIDDTSTSEYCEALAVTAAGVITITTQDTGAATDPAMTLSPESGGAAWAAGDGTVEWDCNLTAGETRHVPSTCRDA